MGIFNFVSYGKYKRMKMALEEVKMELEKANKEFQDFKDAIEDVGEFVATSQFDHDSKVLSRTLNIISNKVTGSDRVQTFSAKVAYLKQLVIECDEASGEEKGKLIKKIVDVLVKEVY